MSCFAYLMIYYLIYINDNKWSQLLALEGEEIAVLGMQQLLFPLFLADIWGGIPVTLMDPPTSIIIHSLSGAQRENLIQ